MTAPDPEAHRNPCPACREVAVIRTWTGATEVDTFDENGGAWTEYHFRDQCSVCHWKREEVTRMAPQHWARVQNKEARIWHSKHGRDEFVEGSTFSELVLCPGRKRSSQKPPRDDVANLFVRCIERDALARVPVEFTTDKGPFAMDLRPQEVARAALSLRLQLTESDTATAGMGNQDQSTVEITPHCGHRVARIAMGKKTLGVTPADTWLDAVDTMWRELVVPQTTENLGQRCPELAAIFVASSAGLGCRLGEPLELSQLPLELLADIAPLVLAELEAIEGLRVEGNVVWLGVAPDLSLPFPARMTKWELAARELPDAFFFDVRPGRFFFLSRASGGRVAMLEESWSAPYPMGVGARLTFAWQHRHHFVDGIRFVNQDVAPAEPSVISPRKSLVLHPVYDDVPPITVAPGNGIVLGRAPHAALSVDFRGMGKRQNVFSAEPDGWRVRDADSPAGSRLNGHVLSDWSNPLCLGDELVCGGLRVSVLDEG